MFLAVAVQPQIGISAILTGNWVIFELISKANLSTQVLPRCRIVQPFNSIIVGIGSPVKNEHFVRKKKFYI